MFFLYVISECSTAQLPNHFVTAARSKWIVTRYLKFIMWGSIVLLSLEHKSHFIHDKDFDFQRTVVHSSPTIVMQRSRWLVPKCQKCEYLYKYLFLWTLAKNPLSSLQEIVVYCVTHDQKSSATVTHFDLTKFFNLLTNPFIKRLTSLTVYLDPVIQLCSRRLANSWWGNWSGYFL